MLMDVTLTLFTLVSLFVVSVIAIHYLITQRERRRYKNNIRVGDREIVSREKMIQFRRMRDHMKWERNYMDRLNSR